MAKTPGRKKRPSRSASLHLYPDDVTRATVCLQIWSARTEDSAGVAEVTSKRQPVAR